MSKPKTYTFTSANKGDMKITKEKLYNFLAEHGEEVGASEKSIEFVGLDTVLKGINNQTKAKTSAMYGATAILEEHTDAEEALWDYFCDGAFDYAFDKAFFNR